MKDKTGKLWTNFVPAVSRKSEKSFRTRIHGIRVFV
jgi:hypothetical protein